MSGTNQQPQTKTAIEEAVWLDVGAKDKALSVVHLAPPGIRTVVDIGAGTGAVLAALDRLEYADRYWACEPSELHAQIPALGRLEAVENTTFDRAFTEMTFDLAIISHVAEHLLSPAVLIAAALDRARWVLVEVPLDGSPAGNARQWLRSLRSDQPRDQNIAGHVQFFSRRSARNLIGHAGGVVQRERGYFPQAAYQAQTGGTYRRMVLKLARHERVARLYHEHFAMLCTKRELSSDWRHIYSVPI